jgi:tRNA-2-methylthio-N6-dimethylallyladenosine synthase
MGKKIYLQTFGCQMNVYDSERLQGLLVSAGHTMTAKAENADVIVLNTCSVRGTAESRALGRLSEFQRHKQSNPEVMLVVAGCMAQRMGEGLLREKPHLDLVLGPDQIFQLPRYLQNHSASARVAVCSSREGFDRQTIWEHDILPERKTPFTSFVAISRGCDNFCSYCVVPYVRGPERHRPADQILREVQFLAESGCREVTLIGQNVNSYHFGGEDFSDLLQMVAEETKIDRIRFMTSHPKDLSGKLIDSIDALPKVCEHIHLPLQSGSDMILKKMNRGYTSGDYLALTDRIKARIHEASITTDIIVGFPTETEEEFEKTLSLVRDVEFDSAFMFRYSVREGTKAALLEDDIPEKEKLRRLHLLIDLQKEIALKKNQHLVGKTLDVLVDDRSRRTPGKWKGKTRSNKTVVLEGGDDILGRIIPVAINEADGFTLFGKQREKVCAGR